jgi:hypothetical protein
MSNNQVKVQVGIQGVRPLLWHMFTPASLPLERQERTGVAGNDPFEWQRTVLADPITRQLYIPGAYVFSCMREASKFSKKGKRTMISEVSATLQVVEERIPIPERFLPEQPQTDPQLPVYLDIRGVRNPSTKGQNVRYRIACSAGWTCNFTLTYDCTVVATNTVRAILNDAGKLVGIGNGRTIGMGRFDIIQFESEKLAVAV